MPEVARTKSKAYSEHLAAAHDALTQKLLRELGNYYRWLDRTGAKGFLGELGVSYQVDSASWNAAMDAVYYQLDKYKMWATAWAAGRALGSSPLQVYTYSGGTWTPTATASIVEKHPTVSTVYERGVNLSGAEYGTDALRPGTENTNYFHHAQADYDFLAGRGHTIVRFPFRWERLQPTLGAALDSTYLTSLTTQVTRAGNAGLKVILDPHNSGGYFAVDGIERAIGAASGPTSANFADFWTRVSNAFQTNATVIAYDLMNEPHLVTPANWETYAQAAVSAIRTAESTGTHKLIMVPVGEDWTNNPSIEQRHPSGPWITDTASNHRYTAHLYPITANWDQAYSVHNTAYETQGYRRNVPDMHVAPHDHSDPQVTGNQPGQRGGALRNPTWRGNLVGENDAVFPFKRYRFRTSGGALDYEISGSDLWESTWTNSDFTGTQTQHRQVKTGGTVQHKTPLEIDKHFRYTTASTQTVANGSTITPVPNNETVQPVSSSSNVTGIIMEAGSVNGQTHIIINVGANTITFNTTSSTSRVAESTAALPAGRATMMVWLTSSSRWHMVR